MKLKKRIIPIFLVLACVSLSLTACGATVVDNIKVTKDEEGKAPEVSFPVPYQFKDSEESVKKFSDGKGSDIKDKNYLRLASNRYDPKTGKKTNALDALETFGLTEQYLSLNGPRRYEVLAQALESSKVGALFVFLSPSSEQSEGAIVAFRVIDITADESVVEQWRNEDARRTQDIKKQEADMVKIFSRDEVEGMKRNNSLPTVAFGNGKPEVSIPGGEAAPEGLVVDVVDEGSGEVVKDTDNIKANYVLYRWKEPQKVVQSSYDSGNPIDISLENQAIGGWKKGLAGQKVGSKVLLTVPPELAYGTEAEAKAGGVPAGTLVFLVEIIAINPPNAASP